MSATIVPWLKDKSMSSVMLPRVIPGWTIGESFSGSIAMVTLVEATLNGPVIGSDIEIFNRVPEG